MILLSVGTQLPFDRLVTALDRWAARADETEIIAQIGPATYQPSHLRSFDFMAHEDFKRLQKEARLMVSHAGMGSIITALELGTPIIIFARDHRLGEHRNGHQMATLQQFRDCPGVYVAETEDQLLSLLDNAASLVGAKRLTSGAPADFIQQLSAYIDTPCKPGRLRRLMDRLRG